MALHVFAATFGNFWEAPRAAIAVKKNVPLEWMELSQLSLYMALVDTYVSRVNQSKRAEGVCVTRDVNASLRPSPPLLLRRSSSPPAGPKALLLLMTERRGWEDGERVHSCTVSLTLRLFIRMDGNVFPDQEQLLVFLRKLKEVFDVCDEDADGFIRVEHFVDLGLQFGQGDEVRTSLYISTHSFPSFWNGWLLMLQSTFVSYSLWD